MINKAMIMAAGVGSRLDPLTKNVPKPLIPIANKPLMDFIMEKLENSGIKEVIANTYCLADQIQKRYTENNPTNIKFHYIQEETLSGTAGGVKKCEFFFKDEENFLVLSGDGLTDINLKELFDAHESSGAVVTMALTYVPHNKTCNFGVVVVDGDGFVSEFQEKPPVEEAKSNLINTGIYVFRSDIFKLIPADTFYDFAKNVFPRMLEKNIPINTYVIDGYWSDIGTIAQYRQSTVDILNSHVNIGVSVDDEHIIGDGSTLGDDVKLLGGNVIGRGCKIGNNVTLNNCIIWNDVVIEDDVHLKNVIVMNGVVNKGTTAVDTVLYTAVDVNKKLMSC